MLFNSLAFAVFLPVVFILYWFVFNKNFKVQNIFLLVCSYVFYSWWDWRFPLLLFATSAIDFYAVYRISNEKTDRRRKFWVALSCITNLSVLFIFKYFNFFIHSVKYLVPATSSFIGWDTLEILLPIGISFYTFQSISFVVDTYRKGGQELLDPLPFFTSISFFPHLVAGPIVRASYLIPQFRNEKSIDSNDFNHGMFRIASGFFKKLVIADNIALVIDPIFQNPLHYSQLQVTISVFLYAFQIYCDFSGYTNIAIGTARLFGIYFEENFRMPYFSKSFKEFWTRWHISLSSWLRDYLYISLGGNRAGFWIGLRNTMITMLLGGLWHGANYTFVIWGALHGLYICIERIAKLDKKHPLFSNYIYPVIVFVAVMLTWIFFRSNNLRTALNVFHVIFNFHNYSTYIAVKFSVFKTLALTLLLFFIEFISFHSHIKDRILKYKPASLIIISCFVVLTVFFGVFEGNKFIYFQF